MRLLLLAPPGGGKGTQGERLAERLGVQHVSAGERLRAEARSGSAAQGGRSDDTAAVIRHRLDVFTRTTGPLVDYYRDRGILCAVDADRPRDAVTTEILTRLSGSPIREKT